MPKLLKRSGEIFVERLHGLIQKPGKKKRCQKMGRKESDALYLRKAIF
jgi:hypothetical protein